jgi:hypothetical protein
MVLALTPVAAMAVGLADRPARDGDQLAPSGLQTVLALEVEKGRAAAGR